LRNIVIQQKNGGYIGCSAAISGTDFSVPTSELRIPILGITSSEAGSTAPNLLKETVELIPSSRFHLVSGRGHLPCLEKTKEHAKLLTDFLCTSGHI